MQKRPFTRAIHDHSFYSRMLPPCHPPRLAQRTGRGGVLRAGSAATPAGAHTAPPPYSTLSASQKPATVMGPHAHRSVPGLACNDLLDNDCGGPPQAACLAVSVGAYARIVLSVGVAGRSTNNTTIAFDACSRHV